MLDHLKEYWPAYLVGGLVIAFIAIITWAVRAESQAETFELYKSEWQCVASENRLVTTNILVGKTIVPQVQITEVCINYKRIQ